MDTVVGIVAPVNCSVALGVCTRENGGKMVEAIERKELKKKLEENGNPEVMSKGEKKEDSERS